MKVALEENLGAVEQKVAGKQVMVVEIVVEVAYLKVYVVRELHLVKVVAFSLNVVLSFQEAVQ